MYVYKWNVCKEKGKLHQIFKYKDTSNRMIYLVHRSIITLVIDPVL